MNLFSKLFLSLILLFLVTNVSPVFSATIDSFDSVVVSGEAAIVSSKDIAERNAISEALRLAVEQVAGVYVSSETQVKDFQVLSDEIYTKASGFVSSYDVLEKKEYTDSIIVKIKANVSLEPLSESLKKLGLLRKWTIAVALSSDNKNVSSHLNQAKSKINEVILEQGFRVADQDIIASLEDPNLFKEIKNGNYLAATRQLKNKGVDVLLIGNAFSENLSQYNDNAYGVNVNLSSARSRIIGRLVRADTGELLSTKSFEGRGIGSGTTAHSDSLKNTAYNLAKFFTKEVMRLPASTSSLIQLEISGLSYAKMKKISEALKKVNGVNRVTKRGFRNKVALYEIETNGDSYLLADNLSENKALNKDFNFEILTVSSGELKAKIN